MIFRLNIHWVYFPSIGNIEKAMPALDNLPNWLKRFMGEIANIPKYDSLFLMINAMLRI